MGEQQDQYVVTGPYITVRTMTTDGWRVIGLHQGASLPADVVADPAQLDHLVSHSLAARVGAEPVQVDRSADELAAYHEANLAAIKTQRQELDEREAAVTEALAAARQAKGDDDPNAAFAADQQAAAQREAERSAAESVHAGTATVGEQEMHDKAQQGGQGSAPVPADKTATGAGSRATGGRAGAGGKAGGGVSGTTAGTSQKR